MSDNGYLCPVFIRLSYGCTKSLTVASQAKTTIQIKSGISSHIYVMPVSTTRTQNLLDKSLQRVSIKSCTTCGICWVYFMISYSLIQCYTACMAYPTHVASAGLQTPVRWNKLLVNSEISSRQPLANFIQSFEK